jgi:ferritin-like metal-binding protein YciE
LIISELRAGVDARLLKIPRTQGSISRIVKSIPNTQRERHEPSLEDIQNLSDLFVHPLQDILYVEQQIVKALPTMMEKATSPGSKQGFSNHLRETERHVERLKQVFEMHDTKAKAVDCPAIDGIIKEAKDVVDQATGNEVRDAALTAAAQAVGRYDSTLRHAHRLGQNAWRR